MNPIAEALKQVLLFFKEFLPESVAPFVDVVAGLIGRLDLEVSDPRLGRVAQLVAELMVDLSAVGQIEDATVATRARLLAENRFTRAWRDLGLEGI